jgi:Glycosyltransferase
MVSGKMEKPQIAFFLAELTIGGVENVFITYANELAIRGYDVVFVVCRSGGVLEKGLIPNVRIHDLKVVRARKSFLKFRSYIRNYKPDYIVTGGDIINVMVIAAAMFTPSKVIITEHNYQDVEQQNQGWWSKFQVRLMKFFYPKAYKTVAVSEGIFNYLLNDIKTPEDRTILLYNPIDIRTIEKKGQEPMPLLVPKPYILFVGRISPVKNLPFLLKAYDKLEEGVSLVIVGDGPSMHELKEERMKMKKKDSVIFTGMQSNPLPYIRDAKALVLCSFSEAFPTSLLQAMVFNIPVVATPTPGAKEILAYRAGTFISKNFDDINEFAGLLEDAIHCEDVDLRSHTNMYDMENIMNQLESLLN